MSQPAMSAVWDGRWSPLSDFKLDEWLFFKDELGNKKNNDSPSKLTKYEIAEKVLHDIEDLGRNNTDYWLNEFPLFDEIQTPKLTEEEETKGEQEIKNFDAILQQEQLSPKDDSVAPSLCKQPSDLLSVSYENTATFILSDESIFYFNNEPFLSFTSLQQERENCLDNGGGKENANVQAARSPWDGDDVVKGQQEMALVDELLKDTVLELDQWESDTSRSEISSDDLTSANSSPKEREAEANDPDWKPDLFEVRKQVKRSKPYGRGGSLEDKKLRKKEQNKNAATRYRQKKKAEVCEILNEEKSLLEQKAKLQEKVVDIQNETKCLKALMRDLFRAKGIID